jgi:hypothetical protein
MPRDIEFRLRQKIRPDHGRFPNAAARPAAPRVHPRFRRRRRCRFRRLLILLPTLARTTRHINAFYFYKKIATSFVASVSLSPRLCRGLSFFVPLALQGIFFFVSPAPVAGNQFCLYSPHPCGGGLFMVIPAKAAIQKNN